MNKFINQKVSIALASVGILATAALVFAQTADTIAPTVSVTAPVASAVVSGSVAVSATSTDDVGVAGVQFKLDGTNLGAEVTTAPYSVSWNTVLTSNGAHLLTAVARDGTGNSTTSAPVSVTVSNITTLPPTPTSTPNPEVFRKQTLEINPSGNVQIHNAKVLSNSSSALSVQVWGLTLSVAITGDTKLQGHGMIMVGDIHTGDAVDVKGKMDAGTGAITAREIRDDYAKNKGDAEREAKISELRELIKKLMQQVDELRGKGKMLQNEIRDSKKNNHEDDD